MGLTSLCLAAHNVMQQQQQRCCTQTYTVRTRMHTTPNSGGDLVDFAIHLTAVPQHLNERCFVCVYAHAPKVNFLCSQPASQPETSWVVVRWCVCVSVCHVGNRNSATLSVGNWNVCICNCCMRTAQAMCVCALYAIYQTNANTQTI